MFSKACEHGIKAIIYIATQSLAGKRVKIRDVSDNTGSPEAFTAKILGTLAKFDIVDSTKGPSGGFEISESRMKEIKLAEIVFALDGDDIYLGCALGLRQCDDAHPCPMHTRFIQIRTELKSMLEHTTIFELATQLRAGESVLNR